MTSSRQARAAILTMVRLGSHRDEKVKRVNLDGRSAQFSEMCIATKKPPSLFVYMAYLEV
jgi:hypothetical protein